MPEPTVSTPEGWSFDLPLRLKIAISDAITVMSKLESCIIETLWTAERASLERRQEIAKDWTRNNVKLMRKLVQSYAGVEADAIWKALRTTLEERNLIAHAVWVVDDQQCPIVVWHRTYLESADYVSGERFGYYRFDAYQQRASALLRTFTEFKALLEGGSVEEAD